MIKIKNDYLRKTKCFALVLCIMASLLGCAGKADNRVVTEVNKNVSEKYNPSFTGITFNISEEEMLSIEGEAAEEYPSLYKGTVYRFADKEYAGMDGSVKYMTDDEGNIACMAFLYESDDSEEIKTAYEILHSELVAKYGESGNGSESQGTFGDLWYFDDVHIQISAVITTEYKGVQVSYMDADYSLKDVVDKKKQERESAN